MTPAFLEHRPSGGLLEGPTIKDTLMISRLADAIFSCNLAPWFTIWRQRNIAFIDRLLGGACPPAISQTIRSVIIFPFNAKANRALSHIVSEVGKIQPALTDCNPSSAIAIINRTCRIQTSRFHSFPDTVSSAASSSVRGVVVSNGATSTLRRLSTAQGGAKIDNFLATVTKTKPLRSTCWMIAGLFYNFQFSKALTSHIYNFAHRGVF